MATQLPYMVSIKNLGPILDRIKGAGTPPRFTFEFLKANLGFPSSNDRSVVHVLKALRFLSSDGTPTPRYNEFRDEARSGSALAAGLRDGWSSVFLSDEKAYQKSTSQLTELFKSVTGATEAVAQKMATTFRTLAARASWTEVPARSEGGLEAPEVTDSAERPELPQVGKGLSLHHDVHIHLPATSDLSVYTAIFRALKDELLD